MGKPSIFSREYERKMKKRKIRIITFIVTIILIGFGISIFGFSKNLDYLKKISLKINYIKESLQQNNKVAENKSGQKSQNEDKVKTENDKENNKIEDNKNTTKETNKDTNKEEEQGYQVKLSSGIVIKAVYENKDNDKKFKYISPVESTVSYSISPSNKFISIFDDKAQSILLINIEGTVTDVTKKEYVSSTGTTFSKDSVLKGKSDYIWCIDPMFIDDNSIAYVSNLPWFNKTTKYVWIYSIKDNVHYNIEAISGENIKLTKGTDNKINVLVDSKNMILNAAGGILPQ